MVGKRAVRIPASTRSTRVPLWMKVVGIAIAALVAAHFYLIHQINTFADELVRSVGMFASASHGGGYYTPEGDLGIKKLRVESGGDDRAGLAVSELELDTPGWWWVLQLMNPIESRGARVSRSFDRLAGSSQPVLPATDSLYLRMRGFELDVNALLPPGMPNVGFSTGVPFEVEGCSHIRYLVPLQLRSDLGLPYQQTDLSIGFAASAADQVTVSLQIAAPGVTTSSLEVDFKTDQPRRFLEMDGAGERLAAIRWIINDHGFNAARNRWCAEQAGVDADEFQRRHITSVRRILEVYGVRMSPETEAVYSTFASSGGMLAMAATWPAELSPALYAQYPAEQKWEVLNARIAHDDGADTPLALSFVRPRPLPRAFSGSVYDLLARNADAGADDGNSPLSELGERVRALTAAPDPAQAAAPVAAPKAAPPPARPAAPIATPIGLDTPSLIAAIGEWVSIETDDGRKRSGRLTAVDPKTVTIQQKVSGGTATLDFSRERIRMVVANP